MEIFSEPRRPSKEEQRTARKSYRTLALTLEKVRSENPEIEIEETEDKIKIPLHALRLLARILNPMGEGTPISIVPHATEMTTQAAAEFLGCSRPHVVKLLENGKLPFTKVGKHRRVKFEALVKFKENQENAREELLKNMMKSDEDSGLYDS